MILLNYKSENIYLYIVLCSLVHSLKIIYDYIQVLV